MTPIEKLRRIADSTALDGVADAIREVADEMDWRPIETAPKDGTVILVSEGHHVHCVEWNDEFDWWSVDDNKLGPFRLRGAAPTCWMPAPPAPKGAE